MTSCWTELQKSRSDGYTILSRHFCINEISPPPKKAGDRPHDKHMPPARQVYHVVGNLSSPDFKAAVWGLYEHQDLSKLNIWQQ